MLTAGIMILLLGTGFVIVSLIVLTWRLHHRLVLRRLRAAPRVTAGDLRVGGRIVGPVLITGTTAPGPAGLLSSAAYGERCVWYRTDVIRVVDDDAPADELRSGSRLVFEGGAGDPIGLTDPTGTVLLDVDLVLRGGGNRVIVRRRGEQAALSRAGGTQPGSGLARLEHAGLLPGSAYGPVVRRRLDLREQFIAPDLTLSVLGRRRSGAGGTVTLGRRGAVSGEAPDAWIATLEASITSDRSLVRLLPIGLAIDLLGVALIVAGVH